MLEIELIDHKGDFWRFMLPLVFKENRKGLWIMPTYVAKGPYKLTTPPYMYQKLPLPVFTDFWPD